MKRTVYVGGLDEQAAVGASFHIAKNIKNQL